VGHNRRKTVPVWDTREKTFCFLWDTTEEKPVNTLKLFCGLSHTRGKPLPCHSMPEKNILHHIHDRGKPLPCYSMPEKNLLHHIHDRGKPLPLYPKHRRKNFKLKEPGENKLFS
jgi:hypothetical protein